MRRNRRKKITIYDYIADKVPANAHFLINKYGEPKVAGDEMLLWEDIDLIDEEKYQYKVKKIDRM